MTRSLALALAVAVALALLGITGTSPPRALAINRDQGQQIAQQHPEWLLPAWTAGGPSAWTSVGPPYTGTVTLIGGDGSFAPRNHGPGISVWVYDLDVDHLLVPGPRAWTFHLDDDALPIVTGVWDIDDLHVESTFFGGDADSDRIAQWFNRTGGDGAAPQTFIRLQVSTRATTARHVAVYLALRPFGVEPDVHPIASTSCDAEHALLEADGAIALVGLQPADACGTSAMRTNDVSTFALRNRVPRPSTTQDDAGGAEAVLRASLTATRQVPGRLEFRAPLTLQRSRSAALDNAQRGSFDETRSRVAAVWRAATGRVTLETPDARVNGAFRAAQSYLYLNRNGALPRSGPLAHDAFWVRDAAYIGEALERIGDGADNEATMSALLAIQRDDGSFPAITDASGPRAVDEWDAPGQAISSIVAHYRFSHDRMWLERAYPAIRRAAYFIDALRGRTLDEDPETRALLPANTSAEDLGAATWHHYWDDFWAVAAYREAAFAASELGQADDADAFSTRAEDMQSTVLHSIDLVRARSGRDLIPNGPEDLLSSAMARGTTPSVWPVRAVRGADELLQRSFTGYYDAFFAPQSGGYRHYQDTLWPYGGLGVAHAMLRLGMWPQVRDVLRWTLDHQTLPGTYAWGEAINPVHGGLELGDMPHSWAAAELIGLLRDMLITEDGGWLVVNSGAPDEWFEGTVSLQNAPTHYGVASVSFQRTGAQRRVELSGQPPSGWRVRLPGPRGGEMRLSPGAHTLVLDD